MVRAARSRKPFLVEATANQVNQYGGYTGMTPRDFAAKLSALAEWRGVPDGLVSFGGDHLGPYPWRKKPADEAMAEAEQLVRAFVAAGARRKFILTRAWPWAMILRPFSIPRSLPKGPRGSAPPLNPRIAISGTAFLIPCT